MSLTTAIGVYSIRSIQDELLASRLLPMGIRPGQTMHILKKLPFRGAYLVEIDGLKIALRRQELDKIELI
ncbi:MAG: ferrous iron transport protein A [Bacteroidota bacterium]|nr:ferrous iron transport protein A [Bacteroidota bacterium]